MRSEREYQAALGLIGEGLNDSEIGRELGIPRGTVRDWRAGVLAGSRGRTKFWSGKRAGSCFRCDGGFVDQDAYTYLLGIYLGDGCLSEYPRGVQRLRVACDLKYPEKINEIAATVHVTSGKDGIGFVRSEGCVYVSSYWKHWICVFPQHGQGRKHERRIELAPWQRTMVADHPKALIRGLIQSDGNRHINRVKRNLASGSKWYAYPRYMFTNASTDILGIFTDALDLLGVHWTRTTARDISVARREDVAFLDTFVGPKR